MLKGQLQTPLSVVIMSRKPIRKFFFKSYKTPFEYTSAKTESELRKIWKAVLEIGIDANNYFYHVQLHLISFPTKQ